MPTYKILFFSAHEWSNLWRRKQRLAHELSKRPEVASVLYVSPPVNTSILDAVRGRFEESHLGQDKQAHRRALSGQPQHMLDDVWSYTGSTKTVPLSKSETVRRFEPLLAMNDGLYYNRLRAALNKLPGDDLLIYTCHPTQSFALDAFSERAALCYDWTDDWASFELQSLPKDEIVARNGRLIREADLVTAVSLSLYERAKAMNPRTVWMPNATSLLNLNGNSQTPDAEVAKISRPRLGYMGQIGDRVDFDLLQTIAKCHPTWSIVMMGPVWSNRVNEAEILGQLPNVHFVGPRPYEALPGILGQLDICLIPHTVDALTASMDPIKLYDYLATGKPIITTSVAGVDRFADAIYIAGPQRSFEESIAAALAETDDRLTDRRLAYARQNTWSARAGQIWEKIQQCVSTENSAETSTLLLTTPK